MTGHRLWTTRLGRRWLPGRALDDATFYVAALGALRRLVGATISCARLKPLRETGLSCARRSRKGAFFLESCHLDTARVRCEEVPLRHGS